VEMVEGVGVVVVVEGLVEAVGLPILWCTRLGNQGQVCSCSVLRVLAFVHRARLICLLAWSWLAVQSVPPVSR
jgi:hypothetical protein